MEKELNRQEEPFRIVSIDELYGVYRESLPEELIIDVRPQEEYKKQHIDGSISLPSLKIAKSSLDLSDKKRVYLLGVEGDETKASAAEMARIYTDSQVHYVATGGFKEWLDKKYPIIAENKSKSTADKSEPIPQNEPDQRNVVKTSRLLPEEVRSKVEELLPSHIKMNYFLDRGRKSYLISDLDSKEAIVVNPLMEIHHHLIDQAVRLDCEIKTAVYFDLLEWENSPHPKRHADDYAKINEAVACTVSDVAKQNKSSIRLESSGADTLICAGVAMTLGHKSSSDFAVSLEIS